MRRRVEDKGLMRSSLRAAVDAVVNDCNLVEEILSALACEAHGCGPEFWSVSACCKLWRTASLRVDEQLTDWCESSWSLSDRRMDHRFHQSKELVLSSGKADTLLGLRAGCYDWEIRLNLQKTVCVDMDDDDGERSSTQVNIAFMQLRVPNASALPRGWSRRAEWTLSLQHPTDSSKTVHKFFRIHFHEELTEFPPLDLQADGTLSTREPDGDLFSFGITETLLSRGLLRSDARMSFRVRVNPGRMTCVREPNGADGAGSLLQIGGGGEHALLPAGALTLQVRAMRASDRCRFFWCDVCCRSDMPIEALQRCSRGCNYDVCTACFSPSNHRVVERMCIGWSGRERMIAHGRDDPASTRQP